MEETLTAASLILFLMIGRAMAAVGRRRMSLLELWARCQESRSYTSEALVVSPGEAGTAGSCQLCCLRQTNPDSSISRLGSRRPDRLAERREILCRKDTLADPAFFCIRLPVSNQEVLISEPGTLSMRRRGGMGHRS